MFYLAICVRHRKDNPDHLLQFFDEKHLDDIFYLSFHMEQTFNVVTIPNGDGRRTPLGCSFSLEGKVWFEPLSEVKTILQILLGHEGIEMFNLFTRKLHELSKSPHLLGLAYYQSIFYRLFCSIDISEDMFLATVKWREFSAFISGGETSGSQEASLLMARKCNDRFLSAAEAMRGI